MIGEENTANLMVADKKPDWPFYIAWTLWTTFCIPIAYFIIMIIMLIVALIIGDTIYVNGVEHITEDYLSTYLLAPVMGIVTGAVQYGLLRPILPRMGWWVPATTGGWLLGMFLVAACIQLHWMVPAQMDLTFLLMGLSIGLAQWPVLRRRLPGAGWWPVASLLGWGLVALANRGNTIDQYGLLVLGFFPACTTAAALALLTKQLPQAEGRTD
jgi:hypothetical protein